MISLHLSNRAAGALVAIGLGAVALAQHAGKVTLTEVYHNDTFQITGVSVSKTGRLFVNFPRWSDSYLNAVMEVMPDGSAKPFPDEYWNRWDKKAANAGKQFVCVQSVVVDDTDALWILDPAVPLQSAIVPGGPKLVKVDLSSNKVARVIGFGADVAKPGTYLNDVRFDTKRNAAYITDSGAGGIIVVDLASGKARRTLDGHPSVMVEQSVGITIDGKPVLSPDGKPPNFQADSIALSPDGEYLYYQALRAATLYRIKTELLRDTNAKPETVAAGVEKVTKTFPTDGIWMDSQRRIYFTGLTQKAILRLPPNGKMETLVTDDRLQWPDTFSEGPDGSIYVTTSFIHQSPTYNQGKSVRTRPYSVYKFKP